MKVNPFCQKLEDMYRKEIKIMIPQLESIDEIDFYGNILEVVYYIIYNSIKHIINNELVNEMDNSNISSYRSFLKSLNDIESARINSTDEPINYSYSIDSNKKNNDKLDESKIYCIDQRIKNVEQVLQNIADTKYNEELKNKELLTQNDLKIAFEQALNSFSKINNTVDQKKINNCNDDEKCQNYVGVNDLSDKGNNINNSNDLKLNAIENQISEIMKFLEYKNQLEDLKVKIINDLKNSISLKNENDKIDINSNDIPVRLEDKTKENIVKSDSKKKNRKNTNTNINTNISKVNNIKNIKNKNNSSIQNYDDIDTNENNALDKSNTNIYEDENKKYISISIDSNKELLKTIDELNIELAKVKKENYKLKEILEDTKIKNKKQNEYCLELENKVKNNMENEKKFHKDYMEIKDQMITLKNQVNEKESINNKIKEELQTKDNRCKKLEIEITSIKSQNQDNIIKKTREEINSIGEKLRVALNEKAKISLKFLKEKEQYKCKMADAHKEVEIYQTTIKQFQQRVNELQEIISTKDKEFNQKEKKLKKLNLILNI
ncbi:hypothetical protein U3516DRAFT_563628 [Neocallimastix sp. 'constans']